MSLNSIVTFFTALANLTLASVLLLKDWKNIVNFSFALFAGVIALWSANVGLLQIYKTLFLSDLVTFFGFLIGVSFVLFAKIFPDPQYKLSKKFLLTVFVIPTFIYAVLTYYRLIISGIVVEGESIKPVLGPFYPLLIIFALSYIGYGLYLLIAKYRRVSGLAKLQMRYVFWGLFFFITATATTNVLLPAVGIAALAFIGPAFSLIMVSLVSYCIIRHRLMDINLVLGKGTIASFSLLVTAVIPVLGVVFLNDKVFVPMGLPRFVVPLIVATIVILIYTKVQNLLELHLGKFLVKEILTFRALLKKTQKIFREEIELEKLGQSLMDLFQKAFSPEWQALLVFSNDKGGVAANQDERIYKIHAINKKIDQQQFPPEFFEQLENLAEEKLFTTTEALYGDRLHRSLGKTLQKLNAQVYAPLFSRGQLIGSFILGPREEGKVYSKEELDILQVILNQAAISIDNARLYQETQEFNLTLQEKVQQATADLRKAYEELKTLDKMKDELIGITSHELRTPMTSIKSYLWMILKKKKDLITDPKALKYLTRSYESADRMIKLVNDMLTVTEIEGGKIQMGLTPQKIEPVIDQVVTELSVTADEKKVQLAFTKSEQELPNVSIDADRMREVLTNLISNAIKYTPEQGQVTISAIQKDKMIEVSVQDTGKGISKEDQERLFKKFGRIEGSFVSAAEAGGTGLGLYICKSIVELHKGKIWVESQESKGSTFTFSLPIDKKDFNIING